MEKIEAYNYPKNASKELAMVFFSDSHVIVDRFGEYILEFQHSFATHHVPFGSPDEFCALPRNLKSNPALREDFSNLVRSLMEKESGNVSLRIVLTIVAIASGGTEIASSGLDTSRPVNQMVDFLISAAGGTQIDADHMDSLYPNPGLLNDHELSGDLEHSSFEPSAGQKSLPEIETDLSSNGHGDYNGSRSHRADNSLQLNESLARLELNSHEVKLYLDSIDQRISRMEPHLESRPAPVPHKADPTLRPAGDTNRWAAASAVEEQPPHGSETPVLRQPPSLGERAVHTIPRRRLALWPALLTITALLIGVPLYRKSEPRPTYTQFSSVPNSPNLTKDPSTNISSAARAPSPSFAPAPASSPARKGVLNPPSSNLAPHPVAAGKEPDTPESSPTSPPPASNDAEAASDIESGSQDTETEPSSSRMSYSGASAYRSTSGAVPLSSKTVSVSSGVMAANLISAPMPSYPKLAKLTHMQGEIVLQAVISRKGTVEHLHVIKGHRLLRGSAMNAVKSWRYRPYIVNGRAVEVATIVTVDFKLKH